MDFPSLLLLFSRCCCCSRSWTAILFNFLIILVRKNHAKLCANCRRGIDSPRLRARNRKNGQNASVNVDWFRDQRKACEPCTRGLNVADFSPNFEHFIDMWNNCSPFGCKNSPTLHRLPNSNVKIAHKFVFFYLWAKSEHGRRIFFKLFFLLFLVWF